MNFYADMINLFDEKWAVVAAGGPDGFNAMTISWGGIGTLWSRPVATVYIKPVRYTHDFMEKNDRFTVSFFRDEYRKALGVLGSVSGRDCDKIRLSGLNPEPIGADAVGFKEAEATLVCRKIYSQDLAREAIPDFAVENYYKTEEPHTMYVGEIVDIIRR